MLPRVRGGRAALTVLTLAGGLWGCSHQTPLLQHTPSTPEIRQLEVGGGANAFVVMGARPILIDTGWGATPEKLERALAQIAVKPHDLALIVLTHGHGDHAGGAARIRELSGAKVLAGRGDLEMLQAGHNRPLKPMGFLGRLLRSYSDKPFPPLTPDILVDAEFDLRPFGVDGKVVPMAGHTPGSLVVVLASGDAIAGDMLRGGAIASHSPTRHLFHDDCRAAEAHLAPLVQAGSRRLFVGHGGPLDGATAVKEIHPDTCP
jgi:hydroxyacylglutathione hydrolase